MLPFVVILTAVLMFIPLAKILQRMDFYRGYSLLYFVPFGSIVGLWLLALQRIAGD